MREIDLMPRKKKKDTVEPTRRITLEDKSEVLMTLSQSLNTRNEAFNTFLFASFILSLDFIRSEENSYLAAGVVCLFMHILFRQYNLVEISRARKEETENKIINDELDREVVILYRKISHYKAIPEFTSCLPILVFSAFAISKIDYNDSTTFYYQTLAFLPWLYKYFAYQTNRSEYKNQKNAINNLLHQIEKIKLNLQIDDVVVGNNTSIIISSHDYALRGSRNYLPENYISTLFCRLLRQYFPSMGFVRDSHRIFLITDTMNAGHVSTHIDTFVNTFKSNLWMDFVSWNILKSLAGKFSGSTICFDEKGVFLSLSQKNYLLHQLTQDVRQLEWRSDTELSYRPVAELCVNGIDNILIDAEAKRVNTAWYKIIAPRDASLPPPLGIGFQEEKKVESFQVVPQEGSSHKKFIFIPKTAPILFYGLQHRFFPRKEPLVFGNEGSFVCNPDYSNPNHLLSDIRKIHFVEKSNGINHFIKIDDGISDDMARSFENVLKNLKMVSNHHDVGVRDHIHGSEECRFNGVLVYASVKGNDDPRLLSVRFVDQVRDGELNRVFVLDRSSRHGNPPVYLKRPQLKK